jgi:hypothetical protein
MILKLNVKLFTFVIIKAAPASRGLIAKITSVSFHPYAKPTTKPAIPPVNHCVKPPNLSPIPSCIFDMSLKKIQC